MSFDILKQEIKSEKLRNLYLFYGVEDFLIKKYISLVEKMVVPKDFKDMNMSIFDEKIDQNKLIEVCETAPFLSPKRLVICKNSGIFKPAAKSSSKAKESSKKKKTNDLLTDFLKELPSHVCLIFCEMEIDKRIKYVEIIRQNGLVVEFTHQKTHDLAKWIVMECKNQNVIISQEDAVFLVEYSEPGMNDIYTQMQKLILYVMDKGVAKKEDIEKVCEKSIKSRIFDLTDAISERNVKKSLSVLNDMIELREPMSKIFFMIAKQFRNILTAKLLIKSGITTSLLASKMEVHPFVAEKLYKQAGYFSINELREAVKSSYSMDIENKNSNMGERISAELLIANFASSKK